MALQQFLSTQSSPCIRYDVRPDHAALLGFIRGFAEAVFSVAPGARTTVADVVTGALQSQTPGEDLAEWLNASLAPFQGTIAIDDLHHAQGDSNCTSFLATLIERTKHRIRWILATRSMLHLPMATWVAQDNAPAIVSETDFALTYDEALGLARAIRSDLSDGDIDRLQRTTSGWMTAFRLALHCLKDADDLHAALVTARQLSYEYFAQHVYSEFTNEEQLLLEFAMLLPGIDVELLERAGFSNARKHLDRLHKRVMFLSVDPGESAQASPRLYRCHDLLREYLEHRFALRDERTRADLCVRAATTLRNSGNAALALKLYARARSSENILSMLAECGFQLLDQAHGDAVSTSIDALPDSDRSLPIVLGLRARQEANSGHYERSKALFERAIADADGMALKGMLVSRFSSALINSGQNPIAVLESIAFSPEPPVDVRASLLSMLAIAYAHFGSPERARAVLIDLEPMAWKVDSDHDRGRILYYIGLAAFLAGDAVRARRALENAEALATSSNSINTEILVYGLLAQIGIVYDDDLESVKKFATLEADAAARAGMTFDAWDAAMTLLHVATREGDREQIESTMNSTAPSIWTKNPRSAAVARDVEGMIAAWEGDFARAYAAFSAACEGFYDLAEERTLQRGFCALFAIANGQREVALELVRQVEDDRREGASDRPLFARNHEIARLLCAMTLALSGKASVARKMLRDEALASTRFITELHEVVRCVAEGAKRGTALAALTPNFEAMRSIRYGGWARVLERVLSVFAPQSESVSLTKAELKVLRLLDAGDSPKDIAFETGVSVHTVRTHIKRIIAKFGCSGSDQAVRAARSSGILR